MEALFLRILNMSITATYVLIAVLVLRLLLRGLPKWISYSLWSLVLFRLVCPVSFSSAFSIFGRIGKTTSVNNVIEHIPADIGMTAIPQVDIDPTSVNTVINNALPAASPTASVNPTQILIFIGACIWLTGVAVILIYSFASYLKIKYRIREATLLTDNVFETDKIASPFVYGLINPKMYVPVGLQESERGYVICHEQTHIARKDHLIKPLAFLVLSVHWFNPFMWLAFILMSRDLEMSCDEHVISRLDSEGKAGYASALIQLAMKRPILAGSPLAFGESGAKDRVKNILNYKKPAFWVLIIAVLAVAAICIGFLSNPIKSPSMDWAKSLILNDIQSIELVVMPSNENERYRKFEQDEFADVVNLVRQSRGSLIKNPEPLAGGGQTFYITTKDGLVHKFSNNGYLVIDGDTFDAGYDWLSSWNFSGDTNVPEGFWERVNVSDNSSATEDAKDLSGIEIFVWKDNNQTMFSVFQGIKAARTEDEIYSGSMVFSDITDVNRVLETYQTDYMQVSIRQMNTIDFTKNEMGSLADRLKVPAGNYSVGIGIYVPAESSDSNPLSATASPSPTTDLEQSISNAILSYYTDDIGIYGNWYEVAGEGHIILETEEKGGLTYAYIEERYNKFGFQNGILTGISGHINPATIIFEKDSQGKYIFKELIRPKDGSEYGPSIKRMFSASAYEKLYSDDYRTDYPKREASMTAQVEAYARVYLKTIGRNAGVQLKLTDRLLADMNVEVSNYLGDAYGEYPYWIGTREVVENGVRYIYEKAWQDKGNQNGIVSFIKKTYEGEVVEKTVIEIKGSKMNCLEGVLREAGYWKYNQ